MKKRILTEDEYIAIGKRLRDMRNELPGLLTDLSRGHRLDSKLLRSMQKATRAIDLARSDLENECAARYGDDAALRTFAGGR